MTQEPEQILLLNHPESQFSFDLPRRSCPANAQDNLENVKDFANVCRTCAAVTEFVVPIFEGEGLQNKLADKIHQHLPIKVSEQDTLPRVVCYQCASTLLAWHELVKCCLQADEALKTKQAVWAAEASVQEKPGPSDDILIKDIDDPISQDESVQECKTMKEIMKVVQFCFRNHKDLSGLLYACQMCEWKVLHGPALLTDHLHKKHSLNMNTRGSVIKFIENNVSIVELLESEDEDKSEIVVDSFKQTLNVSNQNEIVEDEYEFIDNNDSELNKRQDFVRPTKSIIESTKKRIKANASKVSVTEYPCPFCESVFTSPARLVCHTGQHRQVTINNNHICNVCNLEFTTRKSFVDHLMSRHPAAAAASLPPDLSAKCRGCGFVAKSLQLLQVHIKEKHETTERKKSRTKSTKPEPVQCELCKSFFSDKYNLKAHTLRQHGPSVQRWACARCDKTYRSSQAARLHEQVAHEGALRFVCAACGERFPLRAALAVHARAHAGEAPHRCALCDKAFRARDSLRRHLDAHADVRNYACQRCPKRFRNASHLKRHNAAIHDKRTFKILQRSTERASEDDEAYRHDEVSDDDLPLVNIQKRRKFLRFYKALVRFGEHCATEHDCGDDESSASSEDGEAERHASAQPYEDGEAERLAGAEPYDDLSGSLRRHARRSGPEARALAAAAVREGARTLYQCAVCGARLSAPHTWRHHARIHTGERPAVCTRCGRAFRTHHALHRHVSEVHERARRRTCAHCPTTFANAQNLRAHERAHSGLRPYACARCPKRFAYSGSLHAHARTHEPRAEHPCALCPARFNTRRQLLRHLDRHHGSSPPPPS